MKGTTMQIAIKEAQVRHDCDVDGVIDGRLAWL